MSPRGQRQGVAAEVERQLAVSRTRCRSDTARPAVALTLGQWRTVETILRTEIGQWHQGRGINPERVDTGFMVLAAVRYSLGRPSHAASLCTGWLRMHWTALREGDRGEILADIERHLVEAGGADDEADRAAWIAFVSWTRAGQDGAEAPLAPLAGYRLGILARAPRTYAAGDAQVQALHNRGLVAPTGPADAQGRREWAITEAGRTALERQP